MKTIKEIHEVYEFEELPKDIQKEVIQKHWDWNVDGYEWYSFVFDDIKAIAAIIGITIENIYFSGFSSQGDGAQFEGDYEYKKGSLKAVKEYAPKDVELHSIVKQLQEIQRKNFYRLWANVKHSGHYYHELCTNSELVYCP